MARRRYISTDISFDKRVNKLAETEGGDAALLYTWMVPHANDQGELTADPEELLYLVFPGRRSLDEADVQRFLDAMLALKLIERDDASGMLRFPHESFYRYQSYVKLDIRRHSADNSVNQRKVMDISEEQHEAAQTSASVSSPVPVLVPVPVLPSVPVSSSSSASPQRADAHAREEEKRASQREEEESTQREGRGNLQPLVWTEDGEPCAPPSWWAARPDAVLVAPDCPPLADDAQDVAAQVAKRATTPLILAKSRVEQLESACERTTAPELNERLLYLESQDGTLPADGWALMKCVFSAADSYAQRRRKRRDRPKDGGVYGRLA